MQDLVLALHIVACLVLIVVVLLQSGKEGMGVIFGGGSGSLFGSSGAGGLLAKVTGVVAAIFLATSLGHTYLSDMRAGGEESIMDVAPLSVEESVDKPAPPTQDAASDAADTPEEEASDGVIIEEDVPQPAPQPAAESALDEQTSDAANTTAD